MKLKTIGIGVGAVVAVVAVWMGIDALVETDEERIEVLVDRIQEPLNRQVVDDFLAWTDPRRQPVEVVALGQRLLYDADDPEALAERAHDGIRPFHGQQFTAWQSGIEVEEDDATVTLKLRSADRGFVNVEIRLRRHDDDWLVSYIRVGR